MSYIDDLQVRLSDLFLKAEEAGELSGLFPEVADLLLKERWTPKIGQYAKVAPDL